LSKRSFSILLPMYSFSARILPTLIVLSAFLLYCSRDSSDPPWEPQSHLGSKIYNGGLFPVWITLKEPVSDISYIEWKSEKAKIAYRSQAIDAKTQLISADTAFLYWDEPPKSYMMIDSTGEKLDTTHFYRDTVFAVVDGLESPPIVIEVKNILPRIKKFTVNGLDQNGDSVLTIAANPNTHLEISILLEKTFNKIGYPTVTMPKEMDGLALDEGKSNDSLKIYKWIVPSGTMNETLSLKIGDSRAYGERLYKVRVIVYTEVGSVWVASEKELVKFSSMGDEVARIKDFKEISDIVVNSKNGRLFVTDKKGNSIHIYDTYGKLLYEDSTLLQEPTGIAVGVDGDWIWVADTKDGTQKVTKAQLRRFQLSNDKLEETIVSYQMSGPVRGLSLDQYARDSVWFAIPESDSVGFTVPTFTEPTYVVLSPKDKAWQRPSMVSYYNGLAWVADSGRVVAVNPKEGVKAIIKGFSFVSSVSACGNDIWVSDIKGGKVYRYKGPFGGTTDLDLDYNNYVASYKFEAPISVSALTKDCSVWVIDKEDHKVVLLDSDGKLKASGSGLTMPILGKTLQIVE